MIMIGNGTGSPMVSRVIPRAELAETLGAILGVLMAGRARGAAA